MGVNSATLLKSRELATLGHAIAIAGLHDGHIGLPVPWLVEVDCNRPDDTFSVQLAEMENVPLQALASGTGSDSATRTSAREMRFAWRIRTL
jgi:hypothetical protein